MSTPSSLQTTAIRAVARNIRQIFDIGEIPYDQIRPALIQITNADHLRRLEEASPQIIGHDVEIWHKLIARDAPHFDRNVAPRDPANWWKVHRKFVKEEKERVKKLQEGLRARLKDKEIEKDENKTVLVNKIMPDKKRRWGNSEASRASSKAKGGGAKLLHSIRKEASATSGGRPAAVMKRFGQTIDPAIVERIAAKKNAAELDKVRANAAAKTGIVPARGPSVAGAAASGKGKGVVGAAVKPAMGSARASASVSSSSASSAARGGTTSSHPYKTSKTTPSTTSRSATTAQPSNITKTTPSAPSRSAIAAAKASSPLAALIGKKVR